MLSPTKHRLIVWNFVGVMVMIQCVTYYSVSNQYAPFVWIGRLISANVREQLNEYYGTISDICYCPIYVNRNDSNYRMLFVGIV